MFRIHRSERADALVDALVSVVAVPLDDPFTAELVAVPTRGVERWLTHRIAARVGARPGRFDGICANVEFPFPGRVITDVLAAATAVPDADPWRPERSVWTLLATIDDHASEDWLGTLGRHLGAVDATTDDHRRRRRFAAARHLADLFDRYGIYRPELVLGWAASRGRPAGADPTEAWQARLWWELRQRIGHPSPPERLRAACAAIEGGDADEYLPARLSLFGLTRLPASYLSVLQAIATRRDVHLFALHPSLTLWDRVAAAPTPTLPGRRSDDPTVGVARHPLLRNWGHDTREMQLVLSAAADADRVHHPVEVGDRPATLLWRLQHGIRTDTAPTGAPLDPDADDDERPVHEPADVSLQLHRTHGPERQVDVLRDAIAHALADDPTLEPRDVIVLCPDIDRFAPLLSAAFGRDGSDEPGPRGLPALPFRLADRSLRQANPLLASLEALLELIDGRFTVSGVLAFLGRDPVRARFDLDDDDLERLATWVDEARIRWGLDGEHRARYGLAKVTENTWATGLDRLVLGVAMDTDGSRVVGNAAPVDDVESGDVDLVGRLVEALSRLRHVHHLAGTDAPVADWTSRLAASVDLLMATDGDSEWQRVQVDAMLHSVVDEATTDGDTATSMLTLTEVRDLLEHRLRGEPTRADFRTGAITMCSLVPMRAVPHRVVCLLGIDATDFPRPSPADGEDLLRAEPLVGDRDAGWEDRQLLLDAVLSATDRCIIICSGRDPRNNEPIAPSVPIAELAAAIDATERGADGRAVSATITIDHPLHAFDRRAHQPLATTGTPWSFDPVLCRAAAVAAHPTEPPPPLLDAPLPALDATEISLDDLLRTATHPVREFLRQRLGISTFDPDHTVVDELTVELDALEKWAIGDRIVRRLLRGDDPAAIRRAELAAGTLPPGSLAQAVLNDIEGRATAIADSARQLGLGGTLESERIRVDVDGVTIGGTVAGIAGVTTAQVTYSTYKARHRLTAWVDLVALTLARPDVAWTATAVGRWGRAPKVATFGPLGSTATERRATAEEHLRTILELWRDAMRAPLPLPLNTGAARAVADGRGERVGDAMRKEWETGGGRDDYTREDADAAHVLAFGGRVPLADLRSRRSADGLDLAAWSERLWTPILDAEVVR